MLKNSLFLIGLLKCQKSHVEEKMVFGSLELMNDIEREEISEYWIFLLRW